MVNVGANPARVEAMVPEIRRHVLSKIKRTLGKDIEPLIDSEFTLTPQRTSRPHELLARCTLWCELKQHVGGIF